MHSVVHSVSASVSCFVAQCCGGGGGGGGSRGKERRGGGEVGGGGGGREKAENAVCDGGGGRREKKQTMLQSLVLSGCHQITDVGLRYGVYYYILLSLLQSIKLPFYCSFNCHSTVYCISVGEGAGGSKVVSQGGENGKRLFVFVSGVFVAGQWHSV